MSLYRVERRTKPVRRRNVTVEVYTVTADSPEEAEAIARRRCPQDEFDGPVVRWVVEEDADGIFKCGSLYLPGRP